MESFNFVWMIFQTVIALVVVCGLIYFSLRVVMPKIAEMHTANSAIRVVEKIPIDARKSLLVIEVGGRWMLLGTSENNVNLISELAEKEIEEIEEKIKSRQTSGKTLGKIGTTFSDKLAEIMSAKTKK